MSQSDFSGGYFPHSNRFDCAVAAFHFALACIYPLGYHFILHTHHIHHFEVNKWSHQSNQLCLFADELSYHRQNGFSHHLRF